MAHNETTEGTDAPRLIMHDFSALLTQLFLDSSLTLDVDTHVNSRRGARRKVRQVEEVTYDSWGQVHGAEGWQGEAPADPRVEPGQTARP